MSSSPLGMTSYSQSCLYVLNQIKGGSNSISSVLVKCQKVWRGGGEPRLPAYFHPEN